MTLAQAEFLRRQSVRADFAAWCREGGYEPAKHHLVIIHELETLVNNLFAALVRGVEIPEERLRLMVLTPPGSAKSTYISKLFPPWFLAQCNRLRELMARQNKRYEPLGILACTHNGQLCTEFGGAARNLVAANERFLGYTLQKDSRASEAWSCTNGGYYRGGTVGSGISGRRMHCGIVDDFCGQEADATSKIENEKVMVWWDNDFLNRLQPIAIRVIIANHRNEDDLVGRLMKREGDEWKIIKLRLIIENEEQAEADPIGRKVGEYLWPEYFTRAQVDERMSKVRASGIQQQEPAPEKGDLFQAEWFAPEYTYNDLAVLEGGQVFGASDHAVSEEQRADNTCLGLCVCKNGLLYIHPDLAWDRFGPKRTISEWIRLAKTYRPVWWRAEKGQISKSLWPFLRDQMDQVKFWFNVRQVTPSKDKGTRLQAFLGLCACGRVRWPSTSLAPWMGRAKKEMLVFPNGVHDDLVDFLGHLGMGVDRMFDGAPPVKIAVTPDEVVAQINAPSGMNITMKQIKAQRDYDKQTQKQLAYA